jgi:hypothetical protein
MPSIEEFELMPPYAKNAVQNSYGKHSTSKTCPKHKNAKKRGVLGTFQPYPHDIGTSLAQMCYLGNWVIDVVVGAPMMSVFYEIQLK